METRWEMLNSLSVSFTPGKASVAHGANVEHNNREFVAQNINKERMAENVTYVRQDVEEAYNELFGQAVEEYNAKQTRKDRKITDYFSIFLLLPILIVISGGLSVFMSTMLKDLEQFELMAPVVKLLVRAIPFAFTSLMLIALYVFMPNTKVKFRNAFLPGIVAGIAFQFLQYFYINSQIWVTGYNAIYGSFAAIPLFLLWTQISWCICLFGAQLTYASQNVEIYNFEKDARNISRRYHDFLCILMMSAICKRFANGEHPYTAQELSCMHRIPIRIVNEVLYELQDLDLLYPVAEDDKSDNIIYLPAEDTNRLTVKEVLKRIDIDGSEIFKIDHTGEYSHEWQALARAKEVYFKESEVLLKEL